MQQPQQQQVQLYGITKDDIQAIFEKVVSEHKDKQKALPKWIYLDCSYLYTFELDDFETIRKFCILGRYDMRAVLEWHQYLERWLYDDQSIIIDGRQIRPRKIARSFDRVVNEAMETIAKSITGTGSITPFKYHALGTGAVSEVLPSDKAMVNQISRIDVTTNPNGGSLSRDGSTVYVIGNHAKSIAQGDITETGVFNSLSTSTDLMLDHSLFTTPVTHRINQDVPGSTTIIWQCSG